MRSTAEGKIDSSFVVNELMVDTSNDFGVTDYPAAIAIQADGHIMVTGNRYAQIEGTNKFITKRYSSDGAIDKSFGDTVPLLPALQDGTRQHP